MDHTTGISTAVEHYRAMFERRSSEELRTIAHIKRFNECVAGDPEFGKALKANPKDAMATARARGIHIDPGEIHPKWRGESEEKISVEEVRKLPFVKLWRQWIDDLLEFVDMLREDGGTEAINPRFNAWRQRQIARTESEQGAHSKKIVHSLFAFELSKGCSVACWFCGLGAKRLEGLFTYTPENAILWRSVLQAAVDTFGSAAQSGVCYWATEPSDNPDYFKLIEDYRSIVGVLPQTTSAAPLRNQAWARQLLRMHSDHRGIPSRFSILSLEMLRQVHEYYSAEDLLGFELILQNKESILTKARAGRILSSKKGTEGSDDGFKITPDSGSIACLSGFLVNMVDRTVRLISPCNASERRPLGYRVYYEGTFNDAEEFRACMDEAIQSCKPERVAGDEVIEFREDLEYARTDNGFSLSSRHRRHLIKGPEYLGLMGDMIAKGGHTAGNLINVAIKADGDFFAAGRTIQDLFEKGLLEEDPLHDTVNA
jgi:radical SAM family RiPP maturation amino acid epimerase